ncbi:MAG TPA: MoaD/ThiS family protein [bacterium]|nr:MoaD/ThiS family protein [Candidatus Omnitrophota bacterium]HOL95687.1 MoaD/ThiS family protein [bacterium]
MKITVEYSAFLKQHTGRAAETVETGGPCTVQELLRGLAARYGEPFHSALLDQNDRLRPVLLLSVNEEQVNWHQPAPLHDGDIVTILSPIAGGVISKKSKPHGRNG